MRVAVILKNNQTVVCLSHQNKLYDSYRLMDFYHGADKHGYCDNQKWFHARNIFHEPNVESRLQRINDYLIDQIEKNSEAVFKTQIEGSDYQYLPPVPDCPCMFGVVQNSPQFWRNKKQDIKNFVAGYLRAPGSLIGHLNRIKIPRDCGSFRCAAEFGVVIGREAKNVPAENAMDYVFGYTIVNDMISNSWKNFAVEQNPENAPTFYELLINSYYGRGTRHFGPVGPYIVSKEEVDDPYNLLLYTKLNGEVLDRSYNNAMILDINTVIHQLSSMMTLKPGSIIHMGTMGIDGITIKEDQKLSQNCRIEIEIENVGTLVNYFEDRRFEK